MRTFFILPLLALFATPAFAACNEGKRLGFAHKAPYPPATTITTSELRSFRFNGKDLSATFPCEAGGSVASNNIVVRLEGKIVEYNYQKGTWVRLKLLDKFGDAFYAYVAADECVKEHPSRSWLERPWAMMIPRLSRARSGGIQWSDSKLNIPVTIEGFVYRACDARMEPTSPWISPVTAMAFQYGTGQKLDIHWSKKKTD